MRQDMFKVVVERPRWGGGRSKMRRKGLFEELPSREAMRLRHRGDRKLLNENLQPLRRFLERQVGRPWNKVYSEICATLDADSTVKQHVRDHIEDFVVIRAYVGKDGLVYGQHWGAPSSEWCQPLYVDPRDGILKRSDRLRQIRVARNRRNAMRKAPIAESVSLSDTVELRKLDGSWFEIVFASVPHTTFPPKRPGERVRRPLRPYDVLKRRILKLSELSGTYAARKRQLSGAELRQHGLSNDH